MSQSAVRFERVLTGGATGLQKIQAGTLVSTRVRLYNASVDPPVLFAPSGGAFVTITDPGGVAVVSNGAMATAATGVYTYTWQSSGAATLGDYVITFKAVDNTTGIAFEPGSVGFVLVNESGLAVTPAPLTGINADFLLGNTWASPGAIGSTTRNAGAFTSLGINDVAPSKAGSFSAIITNPTLPGSTLSFCNTGDTPSTAPMGAMVVVTWDGGAAAGSLNPAFLVQAYAQNAAPYGAPGAISGQMRNYKDDAGLGTTNDPYGVVGSMNNDTTVTTPVGAGVWGIVRGKGGAAADGLRSAAETDANTHAGSGLWVYNHLPTNAFRRGVWVQSATDYGVRVGQGLGAGSTPTYAYEFNVSDRRLFSVDLNGVYVESTSTGLAAEFRSQTAAPSIGATSTVSVKNRLALAAGITPILGFGGTYTAGGAQWDWAAIGAPKDDGVSGNNTGTITFYVRAQDGATWGTPKGTVTATGFQGALGATTPNTGAFTTLTVTGTGGAGYVQLANQSSAPGTPTTASRLFIDASNRLSWKGTNGFVRTFDGTGNSADRVYVLPDLAGTVALTANNLSVFAATTSAQLAGVLSDKTGSGLAVFNAGPTITNPVIVNIAPGADFTLTQNAVIPFTSVNAGAVVNTLYLTAGKVGHGVTAPFTQLANGTANVSDAGSIGVGAHSILWTASEAGYVAAINQAASGGANNQMGLLVKIAATNVANRVLTLNANGTDVLYCAGDGSVVVGAPTGGAKGAGSINAVTVWRNGTSLDRVFSPEYRLLTIPEMREYYGAHRHLPTIPTANVHDEGSTEMGALTDHLWETAEVHARYIAQLHDHGAQLEARLRTLEEKAA